jgi:predicted house-cleaning NTP pyrophosphatase (Maf/HAM1 superfamily)
MDLNNMDKDDWMNEAPLLSAMVKRNPFTVHPDYFNELPAIINSRCLLEDHRFTDAEEFSVPDDYFKSLSSRIESRIAEENIRDLVAKDGFTVPADYFSGLKQRIIAKANVQDEAPQAVIKPIRSLKKQWIQYAAAACVTVILGSVVVFNNQNNSIESQMGRIPDQEIINYLQLHSDMGDTPMIMESISNVNLDNFSAHFTEAELEEYINTTL